MAIYLKSVFRDNLHKSEKPSDLYDSYDFMNDIVFIKEEDFVGHLKQLLQLTRSAIFSFVFAVRDKAMNEKQDDTFYMPNSIHRKNSL